MRRETWKMVAKFWKWKWDHRKEPISECVQLRVKKDVQRGILINGFNTAPNKEINGNRISPQPEG